MLRGLFTNHPSQPARAGLAPGTTLHAPAGEVLPVVVRRRIAIAQDGTAVVIVAGERYGTGSSRDWAAKGRRLLGVRAVLACSFERIHRSNLFNMGILPVRLPRGVTPEQLALTPADWITVSAAPDQIGPRAAIPIRITRAVGTGLEFEGTAAIETSLESEILKAGGMLPLILSRSLGPAAKRAGTSGGRVAGG